MRKVIKKWQANMYDWCVVAFPEILVCPDKPELFFVNPATYDDDMILLGRAYKDYRADPETTAFNDGHRIFSSSLVNINNDYGETQNTVYKLGKIKESYRQWCLRQMA